MYLEIGVGTDKQHGQVENHDCGNKSVKCPDEILSQPAHVWHVVGRMVWKNDANDDGEDSDCGRYSIAKQIQWEQPVGSGVKDHHNSLVQHVTFQGRPGEDAVPREMREKSDKGARSLVAHQRPKVDHKQEENLGNNQAVVSVDFHYKAEIVDGPAKEMKKM